MTSGMKNDSPMWMAARTTTNAMTTSAVVRSSGPRCSAAAADASAAAVASRATPASSAAFPASKASVVSKADPGGGPGYRQHMPRAARLPPLQLLLHFLGFFLNLLATFLDIL